jgi:hypothetical protein
MRERTAGELVEEQIAQDRAVYAAAGLDNLTQAELERLDHLKGKRRRRYGASAALKEFTRQMQILDPVRYAEVAGTLPMDAGRGSMMPRYLDPASEEFGRIDRALKARQLKPVKRGEWEIHGPHGLDMDFEVYIGNVTDAEGRGPFTVMVHPRGGLSSRPVLVVERPTRRSNPGNPETSLTC